MPEPVDPWVELPEEIRAMISRCEEARHFRDRAIGDQMAESMRAHRAARTALASALLPLLCGAGKCRIGACACYETGYANGENSHGADWQHEASETALWPKDLEVVPSNLHEALRRAAEKGPSDA